MSLLITGTGKMRKFRLGCAMLAVICPSSVMAEPIGKVRGPFDKFRQFTSHFEFSVPRDISVVRQCVVNEIEANASSGSRPPLKFKSKLTKKGDVTIEKLSWKGKTESGYSYEEEAIFTSGNGWTHIDIDNRFYRLNQETNRFENAVVAFHSRCGLAPGEAFPEGMPRPLAWTDKADDIELTATTTQTVDTMVQCVGIRDEDLGGARISTTLEADHLGAFYAYYILNYANMGAMQRENYAVKISPTSTGTRLELVAAGVTLGSGNLAELRKGNYAAIQIEKCGGVFDDRPTN